MEKTQILREKIPYGVRFAARQLLCLAVGCLLARTRLFEGLPSFAVAYAAAVPQGYLLTASAGAAAGAMLFAADALTGLMGAAAILACGMISFAVRSVTGVRETPAAAMLTAVLCCAASDITVLCAGGFYISGVLLCICDSVLAGGAAYFYVRALKILKILRRPAAIHASEALILVAAACALLLSFSSVTVYVFVPARLLAVGLVLACAYVFAETGGGMAGILCGTALEIACGLPGLSCCYALGGLLGGLFSRRSRLLLPLTFTLVCGLYPLLVQSNVSVAVFAESAFICTLFCFLPKRFLLRVRRTFGAAVLPNDRSGSTVGSRLRTAARAVSGITPYMTDHQLRQGKVPGTRHMTERVQELVCTDCSKCADCWEAHTQRSRTALAECFLLLQRRQYLSPEALPDGMQSCVRRNMLSAGCVQAFEENAQSPFTQRGLPEWICADPFSISSDLLSDAAQRLSSERQYLPQESDAVTQLFRSYEIPIQSASCFAEDGRYTLYAVTKPFAGEINKARLTAEAGRLCGCSFTLPTVTAVGEQLRWSFCQTTQFRLRTGTAQYAADGKNCGDYFLTFAQNNKQYFILCDGMGTGSTAAADAEAAAEIFASLVRADIGFDCALRTVNAALLLREDTESVSTLDVVCVDLYSGETQFCKAGAAASYLLHDGKIECVGLPCMPVGILPEIGFSRTQRTLHKGDTFVLVSDGTCAIRDDPITRTLTEFDGGSAQTLAEKILSRSRTAAPKNRADDSTVLAIVLE